jgi:hypothetical protein
MQVAIRINARWVGYTLEETKNKRELEEYERLRR